MLRLKFNSLNSIVLLLISVVAISISVPTKIFGQTKVETDETVRVYHLGWRDGYVVDVKKKEVLVEFEFAGSSQQKVFNRKNVRRMYETEAIDFGRMWESTSGTKIDAAMQDSYDGKVLLIRPDLTTLEVPLDKLSTRDNSYVKKMQKSFNAAVARGQIPARTPTLPEIENFEASFGSTSTFGEGSQTSIEPLGEIPSYLTSFQQKGLGFTMTRKDQDLVAVIPVGGPDQLVLMTARENNWIRGEDNFQSQLYWASLKKKKVMASVMITPEDYAVDYDPSRRLLLTFNRKDFADDDDEQDHYTLWKLKAGESKAEPLIRWAAKGVRWSEAIFAKIVNERVVIAKSDRQTYEAWDIVDKKSLYFMKSKSFFDAPIVISPDRRHLIVPEDGQLSVIDAKTGELAMGFSVDDRHVSGANINPAGTKLAALSERNIYVWDLESGNKEPTVYPAPLMGSPFKARVEWIDDDHILGESHQERILYRLSLQLPIWSYRMDVRDYFLNRDPLKNLVVNGMFFYVAQPDPFSGSIAVGAVSLPGPGVNEVVGEVQREELYILKKGTPVGLSIGSVSDSDSVEQWLGEKVEANGWVLDDNAEIRIHAEMGIGESQTVTYTKMGGFRKKGNDTTVSFRPHYSRIKIKKGDTIIWQTGTSTGAPPVISGTNFQQKINGYQKPNLRFFQNVKIDPKIIDPKFSRGFGVSKLGLRGIEVVSTTPPGREDDPLAAADKVEEDQKKSEDERKKKAESDSKAGGGADPSRGSFRGGRR